MDEAGGSCTEDEQRIPSPPPRDTKEKDKKGASAAEKKVPIAKKSSGNIDGNISGADSEVNKHLICKENIEKDEEELVNQIESAWA